MREIPIIPQEFKSNVFKKLGKSETTTFKTDVLHQEKWTSDEEDWCWDLYEKGYSYKEIGESVNRNSNSISLKMKRLKKKKNLYNEKHRDDKYATNELFLSYMGDKIKTVLDVFCGEKMFYNERYDSVNNDINKEINSHTNLDAMDCLNYHIQQNNKFDLVDLDAFGATIHYLDKVLELANESIVMTLGELGHKRWKRLDFISKHYDISCVEDINIEKMIECIKEKALQKGIVLNDVEKRDWNHIGRVWFEIKKEGKNGSNE